MIQLDIFQFVEDPQGAKDFTQMSIEEIAEHIKERTGLEFKNKNFFGGYEVVIKKVKFEFHKSAYTCRDKEGVPFISCDVQKMGGDFYGVGSPEDSLEDAVKFFERYIEKFIGGIK